MSSAPCAAFAFLLLAAACGGGDAAPVDAAPVDAGADHTPDTALPEPRPVPPPPPAAEPGRHDVTVLGTWRVIPSPGLPPDIAIGRANNNLDVVRHGDGRVYLAWRTAPDHFASPAVKIEVASSVNQEDWRHEASYQMGTDLREPRLLSFGGRLWLYVSILGPDRAAFVPQGVARAELEPGGFTPLARLGWAPYIVWRTRVERGVPFLVRYLGGENIYRTGGSPLTIELLRASDGLDFQPVDPARPAVYTGGGSEADFTFADDGGLVGVIRNEAADDPAWGSRICRAPAASPATWTCTPDPRKFDSPLLFAHDGEIYLLARRNLTATGHFDLGTALERGTQLLANHLDYLQRPKRCALWRYVAAEQRIAFVLDLPSRGDTCFPGVVPGPGPTGLTVYDYSSDIDGPELTWSEGQARPTFIYRHVLRFAPR